MADDGDILDNEDLPEEVVETDVGEEVAEVEEQPEELTGREAVFAAVEARRREELREEGVGLGEEETPEEVEEPELEDEYDEDEEELVDVKVNGESSKVSAKEIAEYQKNKAAEIRLEEANKKANELAEREERVARAELKAKQILEEASRKAAAKKEKPAPIDKDAATRLSEAILTEDHDAVAEILGRVASAGRQQTQQPPAADIDKIVSARLEQARYDDRVKEARTKFAKDHKDLHDSPVMIDMVNKRVNDLFTKNPQEDPWVLFDTAANQVRDEVGSVFKPSGKDSKSLRQKQQRKKAANQPVRTAAQRANINRDAPPPKTRKQTVAEMVEARNARLS